MCTIARDSARSSCARSASREEPARDGEDLVAGRAAPQAHDHRLARELPLGAVARSPGREDGVRMAMCIGRAVRRLHGGRQVPALQVDGQLAASLAELVTPALERRARVARGGRRAAAPGRTRAAARPAGAARRQARSPPRGARPRPVGRRPPPLARARRAPPRAPRPRAARAARARDSAPPTRARPCASARCAVARRTPTTTASPAGAASSRCALTHSCGDAGLDQQARGAPVRARALAERQVAVDRRATSGWVKPSGSPARSTSACASSSAAASAARRPGPSSAAARCSGRVVLEHGDRARQRLRVGRQRGKPAQHRARERAGRQLGRRRQRGASAGPPAAARSPRAARAPAAGLPAVSSKQRPQKLVVGAGRRRRTSSATAAGAERRQRPDARRRVGRELLEQPALAGLGRRGCRPRRDRLVGQAAGQVRRGSAATARRPSGRRRRRDSSGSLSASRSDEPVEGVQDREARLGHAVARPGSARRAAGPASSSSRSAERRLEQRARDAPPERPLQLVPARAQHGEPALARESAARASSADFPTPGAPSSSISPPRPPSAASNSSPIAVSSASRSSGSTCPASHVGLSRSPLWGLGGACPEADR